MDLVFQAVLGEDNQRTLEAVGLDDVRTSGKVCPVNITNDVRTRSGKNLVTSLILGTAEIRRRKAALLDHCAHGAVEHENARFQRFKKRFLPNCPVAIHSIDLKRVAILSVEILTVFIITMLPTARLWTASTAFFLITTT